MNKVYTSAVVIIPPLEKWTSIQEIRKIYDRNIHRWMPHITLLYPFKPQSDFSKLESLFSRTCKEINAFEISFRKFNYFYHGKQKYTLWLDPEPRNMITFLQNKLLEIVPDCNDVNLQKNGFTPHLSVGQIIGKSNLESIMKILQDNWSLLTFKVYSIYLIARENQKLSEFKIKKEIYLK